MNWGHKIVLSFVVFILLMGFMVYKAFQHDVNLVAEDYYKQEIEYQAHIQSLENTSNLENAIEIKTNKTAGIVQLVFPPSNGHNFNKMKGEVHFFRPSSAKQDIKIELNLSDDGKQFIDIGNLESGRWKIKIKWNENSNSYYHEAALVI